MPVCLIAMCLISIGPIQTQGSEAIVEQLDKAKKNFDDQEIAFREAGLKELQSRYDRLVKQGAKAAADRLESHRSLFETDVHTPIDQPLSATLMKRREDSLTRMVDAYEKAITGYTRKKLKDEADAIERELMDFKKSQHIRSLSDIMAVDTVLEGDYRFLTGNKATGKLILTITERKGMKFKAIHSVRASNGKSDQTEVSGLISGNQFEYRTIDLANSFTVTGVSNPRGVKGQFSNPGQGTRADISLQLPTQK